jgi:hypothetical protein
MQFICFTVVEVIMNILEKYFEDYQKAEKDGTLKQFKEKLRIAKAKQEYEAKKKNYTRAWTPSTYSASAHEKYQGNSHLYVLKIKLKRETFYKIGISVTPKRRLLSIPFKPSEKSIILCLKANVDLIIKLEKQLHHLLKNSKYIPSILFGGYTECFSNIDGILDYIPFDQIEVITNSLSQQEIAA